MTDNVNDEICTRCGKGKLYVAIDDWFDATFYKRCSFCADMTDKELAKIKEQEEKSE